MVKNDNLSHLSRKKPSTYYYPKVIIMANLMFDICLVINSKNFNNMKKQTNNIKKLDIMQKY